MNKTERRNLEVDRLEIRADDDGNVTLAGHAAVFNTPSQNLGGFIERVAPGAFNNISTGDVRALFNHDPSMVLGRTKSNTLRLNEDAKGLAVEIDLPDTEAARTVTEGIKRGDISQMSFGFRTIEDEWIYHHDEPNKPAERTLIEVELRDVSPVTFPAYVETDIALRSMEAWKDEHEPKDERPNLDAVRQLHSAIA